MKTGWWRGLLVLTLVTACAPAKGGREWASIPPVQTGETPSFDVQFEPLKKDKRFFVSFRLDVKNKTDRALTIDWNRTHYLHNGKDYGVFAFQGIDPATLKHAIPPDTIAPGTAFSREIFPAHLVAFTPMREEVLNKNGAGLFPGPLPSGENGIRLVVTKDGNEIAQNLTVEIR
ncbi:MAG: hypothetical protein QG552_3011 [Thermodesulfobacteriota bacterium]|nr:hypothetical protein [Thermodesulfobacteriota bacterium]